MEETKIEEEQINREIEKQPDVEQQPRAYNEEPTQGHEPAKVQRDSIFGRI